MTTAIRRTSPSDRFAGMVLAAGLGLFGALLVIGTRTQWLLVLAPVGAVIIVFAARKPLLALNVMVITEITNLSGVLAPHGGLPLFQASMLLGMVAIALALRDPEMRKRLNAWTVICIGLLVFYLAVQSLAVIGTADLSASLGAIRRTGLDCLFIMVVFVLIQITRRPWEVAAAFVIPLVVLSGLTAINEMFFGGTMSFGGFSTVTTASGEQITTLRYGGPLPDSNFWGRHLVLGIPLAAALLTRAIRAHRHLVETAWMAAILVLLGGIYLTQSRGTFVSAAIAVLVWFLLAGRPVWRSAPVIAPIAVGLAAIPGVGNRLLQATFELSQGQGGGHVDPSLLGRLAAQQQAAMMWQERPVFGFGPGTFPGEVFDFAGRVPTAVREPTDAPHNIYFELAAESGTLGMLSWIAMIAGFLTVLGLRISSAPRSPDRVLAAGAFGAIVGWSVASLALHLAYFRTFGLVLALAGGLAPAWPVAAEAVRRYLHGVAAVAMAGLVGGAVFAVFWAIGASRVVAATQHTTLTPVGPPDGWYAYALDVRSRAELLPTVARIMQDSRFDVDVEPDPVRGLVNFTATASTEAQARNELRAGVERGGILLNSAIGPSDYVLQRVGDVRVESRFETSGRNVALAAAAGVTATVLGGVFFVSHLLPRRTDDSPAHPPVGQVVPV